MPSRALSLCIPLALAASGRSSAAPPPADEAVAQVHRLFLEPLIARDAQTSRFSRAARPPTQRRLRSQGDAPRTDATGALFYAFAIDHRASGGAWQHDAEVGCIYPDTGEIYVARGGVYLSSGWWLGTGGGEAPGSACRAAP